MKHCNTLYFSLIMVCIMSVSSINFDVPDIDKGNNHMTTVVYELIKDLKQNLIFAPISLHSSLSMLYIPAVADAFTALSIFLGNTSKEATSAEYSMLLDSTRFEREVQLELHNKIYSANELQKTFKIIAINNFYSCIEITQPDVGPKVNKWIERQTKKHIYNFYYELYFNTELLAISTIYFESLWSTQFKEPTFQKFYVDQANFVNCEMLEQTGSFKYKSDIDLNAEVIQLPFRNNNISMIIVLPNTDITDLESNFAMYDLNKIDSDMRFQKLLVNIPKFTFTSKIDFDQALQNAGLYDAYTYTYNFNINALSSPTTCLGNVMQQVFIRVDETGIKNAGASGLQVRALPDISVKADTHPKVMKANVSSARTSVGEVKSFKANQPFIFIIRYEKSTLVFGKVRDPTL